MLTNDIQKRKKYHCQELFHFSYYAMERIIQIWYDLDGQHLYFKPCNH